MPPESRTRVVTQSEPGAATVYRRGDRVPARPAAPTLAAASIPSAHATASWPSFDDTGPSFASSSAKYASSSASLVRRSSSSSRARAVKPRHVQACRSGSTKQFVGDCDVHPRHAHTTHIPSRVPGRKQARVPTEVLRGHPAWLTSAPTLGHRIVGGLPYGDTDPGGANCEHDSYALRSRVLRGTTQCAPGCPPR
jgi:hypothetical protein